MEAPSWEDLLFGGEIIWMVGSEYLQQWRWCRGCQVVRRCIYHIDDDDIGGMVQLHLDDGCGWMDERRAVELSGAMVASTAARPGKVNAAVQL